MDHPFRQRLAHAAALAEPGHDRAGRPVVAQARHRTDERVAVGGEGEGAVDDAFHARLLQRGEAGIGEGDAVLDLVQLIGQQFVAEIPGRAIDGPRLTRFFVKADAEAAPFLAQIAFAAGVHDMREFLAGFQDLHDLRHVIGDKVLVRHRQKRQVDARHRPHLARPEAACVDDMFGVDGPLFGHHVPGAVGARVGFQHAVVFDNLRAAHPGRLGIGLRGAGRVEMAVQRIVKRADDAVEVDLTVGEIADLFGAKHLCMQAHVAVLGAFGLQHLEPGLIVGQRDAADMVQPAIHAGDRLKLLVKPDRVALKRGHVGVAVQRVEPARRVPGGAGGEDRAFDQHHVFPAVFRQVIEDGASDDAAPDDDDLCMRFHE